MSRAPRRRRAREPADCPAGAARVRSPRRRAPRPPGPSRLPRNSRRVCTRVPRSILGRTDGEFVRPTRPALMRRTDPKCREHREHREHRAPSPHRAPPGGAPRASPLEFPHWGVAGDRCGGDAIRSPGLGPPATSPSVPHQGKAPVAFPWQFLPQSAKALPQEPIVSDALSITYFNMNKLFLWQN
ncbi:uncharacterized protein LOC143442178 [Arvicanthis niloticus]|uniref:uncharacterized protein LOC143312406 n=1 Tax=Arvicanthis niloticus TaxID=61156 RepID=UPI00402B6330